MRCATCGNEALPGQQFCAEHRGGAIGTARAGDIYATFWRRAGAAIVDYFACVFGGMIVAMLLGTVLGQNLASLIFLLVFIGYYAGFESSALQATPGKLAFEIKVTTLEGERIGFGRAVGRLLGKFVSSMILWIGYLMALFTSHRQTLHDKMAGTFVVRKQYSAAEVANAGPAPPTSAGGVIAVIAVVVFVGIFIVGVLAAIAIPAYQDYTIRSQITAGLNEAAPYKAAVAEAHARGQQLSAITSQSLQLTQPPTSPYVASIEVVNGAVAITYGGQSNSQIAQKVLVLVPATDESSSIVWVCGRQRPPPGTTPAVADAAQYTTIVDKHLPSACRAN